MLTGEALSLYYTIRCNCLTLSDAQTLLGVDFMSSARQNAARFELEPLLFRSELAKANSPLEALESIRKTITRVITQCPERYRWEKFRIDVFRRAIQIEPWAADPIAREDGDDHSFTQFYNNVATRLTLATQNNTLPSDSARLSSFSAGQLPIPGFFGERVTYTPPHKRTNGDRSDYYMLTHQHPSSYSKPRA
mgnify:FL=1